MVAAVFHVCLFFWVKIIFPRLYILACVGVSLTNICFY